VVRRRVVTRFLGMAGMLLAAVLLSIGIAPVAASAAPTAPKAPPRPTQIQIAGKDIKPMIVITAADQGPLFQTVLSEVGWLATAAPQTTAPQVKKLGPKYTLTVLVKNTPQQVYDLYPLATGGPRAHRSAHQPTGKKSDGWFYGRLTMAQSLRVAGVPGLKAKPDVVTGGIGGGVVEGLEVDQAEPAPSVQDVMAEMQRLFLLNGAVLVVIAFGLAGIAYLIRRKV
jgi:hypothetical protein